MQLEELGFCGRGEAKDFATIENLSIGGRLPINTNGGQLGEAYIHGMNGIAEAVRQIRGTSCNQVRRRRARARHRGHRLSDQRADLVAAALTAVGSGVERAGDAESRIGSSTSTPTSPSRRRLDVHDCPTRFEPTTAGRRRAVIKCARCSARDRRGTARSAGSVRYSLSPCAPGASPATWWCPRRA